MEKPVPIAASPETRADAAAPKQPLVKLFATDLLVVDERLTLPAQEELEKLPASVRDKYAQLNNLLEELLRKKNLRHGDKTSISEDEFRDFSVAMAGLPSKMEPGGATADVVTTMKHLMDGKLKVDLLGIAGQDSRGDQLITEDLRKSGIGLDPGPVQGARAAASFVFTHPDGKNTIVTYPGNAADRLKAEMITDERIKASDTVFFPVSLWAKFEDSVPETLLRKTLEQDKKLIVSIPKQARFGYRGSDDVYKKLVQNADVIVCDEAELARWYKTGDDVEKAVSLLQTDLAQRDVRRAASGKAPRAEAATAFIKHKNDSATVLVAQSPPGAHPLVPAARYEIDAPASISPDKHNLGVDDAMYAGFIAALQHHVPPQEAAAYAMDVGQAKYQYDSVRIPSPHSADKETQAQWKELRSGMNLYDVESALGAAQTGVGNPVDPTLPRTRGQKLFDFALYPLIANLGVFALSSWVTYHSNFNQNKANAFVKRSSWFKEQLAKMPGLKESPQMVRDLNMVAWSFIDGSLMAPIVGVFESKRQSISQWFDKKMGTTPDDMSVYEKEVQRNWLDIVKARATTFAFVILTYFALRTKVLPEHTAKEGILAETAPNSGLFEREKVRSVNGLVFDAPAKEIGGWLARKPSVHAWAEKISNKQLKGMAEQTHTTARAATENDVRYQIEGLVNTGLFETFYTSLCTAGLYFLGKIYASKRHKNEDMNQEEKPAAPVTAPMTDDQTNSDKSWAEKTGTKSQFKQAASYLDTIEQSRADAAQVGH